MFDDHAVLEHGDLGVARAFVRRFGADLVAHHHDALDGLAAGQELGLAQDRRPAPAGVTAVAATLPLGLQPGRTADALDLVGGPFLPTLRDFSRGARSCTTVFGGSSGATASPPSPHPDLRRRLRRRRRVAPSSPAASSSAPSSSEALVLGFAVLGLVALVVVSVGVGVRLTAPAAATTTAAPAASAVGGPVGLVVVARHRRRPRRLRRRRPRLRRPRLRLPRSRTAGCARRAAVRRKGAGSRPGDQPRGPPRRVRGVSSSSRDSGSVSTVRSSTTTTTSVSDVTGTGSAGASAGSASCGSCANTSRTRTASVRSTLECALRVRPSSSLSASSTRLLVVPSTRASEWTLSRSGRSSLVPGACRDRRLRRPGCFRPLR